MIKMKPLKEDSLNEVSGGYYNKNAKFIRTSVENNGENMENGNLIGSVSISVSGRKKENNA